MPLFSSLSPVTSILPLVFVITVSMIREGYEDYKRYKSDIILNNYEAIVLT